MTVYLALGSNLHDRKSYLRNALQGLARHNVKVVRCASVYSTEPKYVPDQPWFLNTIIEAETSLVPRALLNACIEVEAENRRTRSQIKGPRTLDIDIVFYGNAIVREIGLTIPHPELYHRRFVLQPLAEIAADFVDPVTGQAVRDILDACEDLGQVVRVGPSLISEV